MTAPQPQPEIEPRDTSLMILGGLRAMDRLAKVIDGEVMRTMIAFRDEKKFEELGYTRFVDFLASPHSVMTKNEFYKREELFLQEGEHLFDLLNGMNIPIGLRKQLGSGNVSVEGDKVIVKDGESETAIQLGDRAGLLEALSSLADANAKKTKQLDKGKEDYRRLKEKFLEVEESGSNGSAISPLDKAHMVACGALSALADQLATTKAKDLQTYLDGPFNLLVSQYQRINDALGAEPEDE